MSDLNSVQGVRRFPARTEGIADSFIFLAITATSILLVTVSSTGVSWYLYLLLTVFSIGIVCLLIRLGRFLEAMKNKT
jgi:hypothetical protein